MSLLNGKKGKDLGFSDFVSSAVRGLFMPAFSLPIILLGVAVGYATDLVLTPLLVDGFENAGQLGAAAGPIATASGISIVTGICLTPNDRLAVHNMRRWFPQRSYGVVIRKGKYLSPAARAFIDLVRPGLFSRRDEDGPGHSER
jgi:hypothetical protein